MQHPTWFQDSPGFHQYFMKILNMFKHTKTKYVVQGIVWEASVLQRIQYEFDSMLHFAMAQKCPGNTDLSRVSINPSCAFTFSRQCNRPVALTTSEVQDFIILLKIRQSG